MSEREYPVPGFPNYTVTDKGEVVSYWKDRKVLVGSKIKGRRSSGRVDIRHDLRNGDGRYFRKRSYQIVAAAKYGRWPEPYEEVRHMDGDPENNTPANLQLGDHLNNVIDDIERGDRQTSVEQLDLAIARLMSIREKLE